MGNEKFEEMNKLFNRFAEEAFNKNKEEHIEKVYSNSKHDNDSINNIRLVANFTRKYIEEDIGRELSSEEWDQFCLCFYDNLPKNKYEFTYVFDCDFDEFLSDFIEERSKHPITEFEMELRTDDSEIMIAIEYSETA